MILKYRFLTHLTPDNHCKLTDMCTKSVLDNLLQVAQTVYYGRKEEEEKRQKKTRKD